MNDTPTCFDEKYDREKQFAENRRAVILILNFHIFPTELGLSPHFHNLTVYIFILSNVAGWLSSLSSYKTWPREDSERTIIKKAFF